MVNYRLIIRSFRIQTKKSHARHRNVRKLMNYIYNFSQGLFFHKTTSLCAFGIPIMFVIWFWRIFDGIRGYSKRMTSNHGISQCGIQKAVFHSVQYRKLYFTVWNTVRTHWPNDPACFWSTTCLISSGGSWPRRAPRQKKLPGLMSWSWPRLRP